MNRQRCSEHDFEIKPIFDSLHKTFISMVSYLQIDHRVNKLLSVELQGRRKRCRHGLNKIFHILFKVSHIFQTISTIASID